MSEPFKGTINVDIRDSVPDWTPFEPPKAPDGAPNVVSGQPYLDLERQAEAMLARE
ncbi:MAG TPA: hypothetical protein VGJ50_26310 [Streptosporangiaceae bacterium]